MNDVSSGMLDIERHLETSFIQTLREVFREIEGYEYSDKDDETRIVISSTYPQNESENKIPHIIVGGVSYSGNVSSLFNNYYNDIIKSGVKRGRKYMTRIPFSINVSVISPSSSESKDLSNLVFNLFFFRLKDLMLDVFQLDIKGVQKSPGGEISKMVPRDVFSQSISVSGDMGWRGSIEKEGSVFNSVKMKLKIIKERGVVDEL